MATKHTRGPWREAELLKALKQCEHLLSRHSESNEADVGHDDAALVIVRAAIAKATAFEE